MVRKQRRHLLGVPVDVVGFAEAEAALESFLDRKQLDVIFAQNPEKIMRARRDPELASILAGASLLIPDGIGVVWGGRLLGLPFTERVTGVWTAKRAAALAKDRGQSLFLLGARPGIAEGAAHRLKELYPGLRIAGTHHGYFSSEESSKIVEMINESSADILLVALGSPAQEKWIARYRDQLMVRLAMGVGGTFDVLTGRVKRAPEWIARRGLEWAWRLLLEPRRARRVTAVPVFAAKVILARLTGKSS